MIRFVLIYIYQKKLKSIMCDATCCVANRLWIRQWLMHKCGITRFSHNEGLHVMCAFHSRCASWAFVHGPCERPKIVALNHYSCVVRKGLQCVSLGQLLTRASELSRWDVVSIRNKCIKCMSLDQRCSAGKFWRMSLLLMVMTSFSS